MMQKGEAVMGLQVPETSPAFLVGLKEACEWARALLRLSGSRHSVMLMVISSV